MEQTRSRTRTHRRWALVAGTATVAVLALTGCGSESDREPAADPSTAPSTATDPTSEPTATFTPPPRAKKLGDAKVAMLASDKSGDHLLLISGKGTLTTVPAKRAGNHTSPRWVKGGVEVPGTTADVRVDAKGVRSVKHKPLAEDVVAQIRTGKRDWTFLDELGGVSVRTGSASGTFHSKTTGLVGCGDSVLGLMADDEMDAATRTLRVIRYRVEGSAVKAEVTRVPTPGFAWQARLACPDNKPVLLASTEKLHLVGTAPRADAPAKEWTWQRATKDQVGGKNWGTVVGVVRGRVVLNGADGIRLLDPKKATTQSIVSWTNDTSARAVLTDETTLLVWGPDPSSLTWFRADRGQEIGSVTSMALADFLDRPTATVVGEPLLLGG